MKTVRVLALLALAGVCDCHCSSAEPGSSPAPPAPALAAAPAVVAQARPAAASAVPAAPQAAPPLPDPLPGVRRDLTAALGHAMRGALGPLGDSGQRVIVVGDDQSLRVLDADGKLLASTPSPGASQSIDLVDVDGDGHRSIVASWGTSAGGTGVRISVYRFAAGALSEQRVLDAASERPEVAAVVPAGQGQLLVAYYSSQYLVKGVMATRAAGKWTLADLGEVRLAQAWVRGDLDGDGKPDIAVGRIYGDQPGQNGDAFMMGPAGARIAVPTLRGVRVMALADSDGDGKNELFVGDGWHQNYTAEARARLSWARWDGKAFQSQVIEDTPGQFMFRRLQARDLDGDGHPELVGAGTAYVRVWRRHGDGWQGLTVSAMAHDVAIGDLDGKPGDELLLVGEGDPAIGSLRSEVVSLAGALP